MPIPKKVADRIAARLKRFQLVLKAPQAQPTGNHRGLSRLATFMQSLYRGCGLLPVMLGVMGWAIGADPAKDPQGWSGVKPGMTRQEVLAELGGRARLEHPRNWVKPLMLSTGDWPDLPAAKVAATQLAQLQEISPGMRERGIAARMYLDLLEPREWIVTDPATASAKNRRQPRPTRVIGTIAGYENAGLQGLQVIIEQQDGPFSSPASHLDKASLEYLDNVDRAVEKLSVLIADAELASDGEIVIPPIEIRGIELRPEIRFVGNAVAKVVLATPGYDNPLISIPNLSGMHRTLCDALAEKYGPADERNETATTISLVWHFPETKLSCVQGPRGIFIRYAPSDPGDKKDQDNL